MDGSADHAASNFWKRLNFQHLLFLVECGDAGTFIADSLIVDNLHEGPGAVDGNLKPISILTYSVVVAR